MAEGVVGHILARQALRAEEFLLPGPGLRRYAMHALLPSHIHLHLPIHSLISDLSTLPILTAAAATAAAADDDGVPLCC